MGSDNKRILIVDDDPTNVAIIEEMLENYDHTLDFASTGEDALQIMNKRKPDLVLLDVMMPGIDGFEVCRKIRTEGVWDSVKIILVTGKAMLEERLNGYKVGADDYIVKPFNEEELLAKIQVFLRLKSTEDQLRELSGTLQVQVNEQTVELLTVNEKLRQDIARRRKLEKELQHTLAKLKETLSGVIDAMALTVEWRDPYTAGHQRRVTDLSHSIATALSLSEDQVDGVRMAGLIHDLGKIAVPAEILSKPSRLTDIEFSLIKTHPSVGYEILKEIEFPWPVAQIVFQHHERMDASGYPSGLAGEEILLEARILAVADVVEAMASHRPYRPALGIDKALREISKNKDMLYDPEVVDICLALFKNGDFEFNY
jgi:putative two-component system response regulator